MKESNGRKKELLSISILTFQAFVLGCAEFAVIGVVPEIASDYSVSVDTIGLLVTAFAISYAVMTPILALATYRMKRFRLMLIYLFVFNAGNLVFFVATDFSCLFLARLLVGAVAGPILGLALTIVPELVPQKMVSMTIAVIYSAYSVAMIVITTCGRFVAACWDYRILFLAVFLVGIPASLLLLCSMPKSSVTDEPTSFRQQLKFFNNSRVLINIATFVFGAGAVYTFYAYITPYLEDILGLHPSQSGFILMIFGGLTMISNLLSGVVDMKFGLKGLIPMFLILSLTLSIMKNLATHLTISLFFIFLIAILMYITSIPCVSVFMKESTEHAPGSLTLAVSMEPMSFNLGIAFGTVIGGKAITAFGLSNVGFSGAILALVAMLLVVTSLQIERKKDQIVSKK